MYGMAPALQRRLNGAAAAMANGGIVASEKTWRICVNKRTSANNGIVYLPKMAA